MRTLVKKRIADRKKQVSPKVWKRMFLVDELGVMNTRVHELDDKIKEVLATLGIEDEYVQIRKEAEQKVNGSKLNAAVDRANSLIEADEPPDSLSSDARESITRKRSRFRKLKV